MNERDHDLLLRSLDADLLSEEAARLNTLLNGSEAARDEYAALQRMRQLVQDAGQISFSPGFTDAVMLRLAQEPAPGLRLIRGYRLMALAASIVLLALVGGLWWTTPRTLEALPGQQITALLPDGSSVELNSGSILRYRPFMARAERRVELDGEAFFRVVPGSDPFIVETHTAQVRVLGTRFNVATHPRGAISETHVVVEEGRVQFGPRQSPEDGVVLTAGEYSSVSADTTRPRQPSPAALDLSLAWRSGGLAFQGLPLRFVAAEIGRRYGRSVHVEPQLHDVAIGYVQPMAPALESVLTDICASVNLAFRRTADGYEIYRP